MVFLLSPALASSASRFLPLLLGALLAVSSFLDLGLSSAFFDLGLSAVSSFFDLGLSAASLFLDFGFSAPSSFLDLGLSVASLFFDLGFSDPSSFLDLGFSAALLSSFLDLGFSEALPSSAVSFLCAAAAAAVVDRVLRGLPPPPFDADLSPSSCLDSLPDVSLAFLSSDLGSGAPFLGSFFDPASFSYDPPAASYSLDSSAAYHR